MECKSEKFVSPTASDTDLQNESFTNVTSRRYYIIITSIFHINSARATSYKPVTG